MLTMRVPILILTACLIYSSLQQHESPGDDTDGRYLSEAVTTIIERKHCLEPMVLDMTMTATVEPQLTIQQRILTTILQKANTLASCRILTKKPAAAFVYGKFNIFLVSNFDRFANIIDVIRNNTLKFNAYGYHIFVITDRVKGPLKTFKRMFEMLFGCFILKSIIVYNRTGNRSVVDIYGYTPFSAHKCDAWDPILINSFEGGELQTNELRFALNLNNFYGCSVKVTLLTYVPFLFGESDSDLSGLQGIDIALLKTLMKHLNFTVTIRRTMNRGEFFANGTANGAMKLIQLGLVNFGIGGIISRPERIKYLSASMSYWYLELVLALPVDRPPTGLENLFLPFHSGTWFGLIGIWIFTTMFFRWLFKRLCIFDGERNTASVLSMANAWLGGPAFGRPRSITARTWLFSVLFSTLIIRAAYQGALYDHLQNSGPPSRKTIQEYAREGYNMNLFHLFEPVALKLGFSEKQQVIMNFGFTQHLNKLFDYRSRFIILHSKIVMDYYNSQNWARPTVRVYPERVFTVPIAIYFTKNSFLKEPFDQAIINIISSGLMEKEVKTYNNRTTAKTIKRFEKYSIRHLEGCFEIYAVLLMLAIFCFVCELFSERCSAVKCILDYLNE